MGIPLECNLREFKSKVENSPNLLITKAYVLGWADKCLKDGIPKNKKEARKKSKGVSDDDEGKPKKPKKKRAPSKYNLWMKECIPREKKNNPKLQHTEVFTLCAELYKKHK